MTHHRFTPTHERGFSLAEVTVALAVTSLLFVAALSMLSIDQRIYNSDDAVLEAGREGRYVVEALERDLLMAGYQVDVRTIADLGPDGTANTDDDILGQPQIAYAAPYEIVFNADVDPTIDAIHHGVSHASTPTGYSPVTFHTGAETIRYTLDSSGDGTIDASDRGDDMDESVIDNTGLYLLKRETYGYNGTDNGNPSGPIGLVRGPTAYPNGSKAIPLFLYWGEFDSDAALDLWGDTGAGGGTAGNGILEPGEIAALGPVTDEDADNDATLDSGEDRNGNGILERRPGELIKRIQIHVTTETSYPDLKYTDPTRSANGSPFHYRSIMSNTEVKPRNIDLPGGACGDEPERTSSPSVTNACTDSLADGKVNVNWSLSDDDGNFEDDIEKYVIWRTDVNSVFGPTPFDEVIAGVSTWEDHFIEMRTWPPRQYWYRVRAMDCTPQLSRLDPIAGPYPTATGPSYPQSFIVRDKPGDDGTNLEVVFDASPDDPSNTTGYGDDVKHYHVYRSTDSDYRCKAPINKTPIVAAGAADYTYVDNSTNSKSGIVYGKLYYYWLRALDTNNVISPYSPRACARAYKGPTSPAKQAIRIARYSASDHPAEVSFSVNERNMTAGYDPYLIEYRIYHAPDQNSDGSMDNMVNNVVGFRDADLAGTRRWDGIFWAVGSGGSSDIYHSIVPGAARKEINPGSESLRSVDFVSRLDGIAVGSNGAVIRTQNGGASWSTMASGTAQQLNDVQWVNESIVIAVGNSGTIIRSEDRGVTWSVVASPATDNLLGVDASGATVYISTDGSDVLVSTDGGLTFAQSLTFPGSDPVFDICSTTGGLVIASTKEKVYRSADAGMTWAAYDFSSEGDMETVDCQPSGVAIVASHSSNKVFMSPDGGITWSHISISPSGPRRVGLASDRLAWVVDDAGDVYYRDHSNSWTSFSLDGSMSIRGLAVRPEIVFEDTSTKTGSSGTSYYYVVTARYDQGGALDGESGKTPDRPSSIETPNDSDPQILVDGCNNTQLAAIQP